MDGWVCTKKGRVMQLRRRPLYWPPGAPPPPLPPDCRKLERENLNGKSVTTEKESLMQLRKPILMNKEKMKKEAPILPDCRNGLKAWESSFLVLFFKIDLHSMLDKFGFIAFFARFVRCVRICTFPAAPETKVAAPPLRNLHPHSHPHSPHLLVS